MNEERERPKTEREREKKTRKQQRAHVSVFCERTNTHKKAKENHIRGKKERKEKRALFLISDDDAETLFTQKNISHKKI